MAQVASQRVRGVRRVVTGTLPDGRSAVLADGEAPRAIALESEPRFRGALVWGTAQGPSLADGPADVSETDCSFLPGPGETRFHLMRFPPDAEMFAAGADVEAIVREQHEQMPGLAETFGPDGMHTTPTLDYAVVVTGEIWLELEDGEPLLLRAGDTVVQHGARHAWRNRSDAVVTMAFIMVGATR
ncbi:MAG TPA: cupin domain-containing protein [Conexibacter sp.]|jgi:hypothetical protein